MLSLVMGWYFIPKFSMIDP